MECKKRAISEEQKYKHRKPETELFFFVVERNLEAVGREMAKQTVAHQVAKVMAELERDRMLG